jgi:hypothetical protein
MLHRENKWVRPYFRLTTENIVSLLALSEANVLLTKHQDNSSDDVLNREKCSGGRFSLAQNRSSACF